MWAGGQAESSGAGVTLLDWLKVMAKSDIVKAYRYYCCREGRETKSRLDCVRDDELPAEASNWLS
jgi:hypothetical protein